MKLCILVGSAAISGGTNVIFQHALYLQTQGADVTVVTLEPLPVATKPWHPALNRLHFATFSEVEGRTFDLALATWWRTVYELARISARQYAYFVQSIESWFYPDSEVALRNLVNSTYLLPLPGITEATWIREHLATRFGRNMHLVRNGITKSLYCLTGDAVAPRMQGRLRVLVEGQLNVDFKNVARTIRLMRRSLADEIWLLTGTPVRSYPGVDRVFSAIPNNECPSVYRSCDVLVKLSYVEGMFGPPLEMFHCGGTAVVYDVTGHEEYIRHDHNALVVSTGDERGAVAAVNRLKKEPDLLERLKNGALQTAQDWPDWCEVSPRFHEALTAIMNSPRVRREDIAFATAEFMRQYIRAEKALQAARYRPVKSLWTRIVRAAERRVKTSPMNASFAVWHAHFVEARRLPAMRTYI